jgi:hypothetical protein
MLNRKKNKTRITDKIKSYMKDVSIDLFNYESIVSENITAYFQQVAKKHQSSENNIQVRISKKETLTGFVYDQSKKLRQVTTPELIDFFMGEGSAELMEKKVEQNVLDYLAEYATTWEIKTEQLTIVIAKPAQNIVVGAYRDNHFMETIPLKKLIKHFSVGKTDKA